MARAAANPIIGNFKPRVHDAQHEKVTTADKLAFFRQLNTLFRAGTPLYDALVIASDQTESKRLGVVVKDIADKVSGGASLSAALASHPRLFLNEWVQLVRSGEVSGQLGDVLLRLAGQIEESAEFRSKVLSSLMYPMIVLCVSMSAVVVMLVFVVPTFAQMFTEMGKELPDLTLKVMAVSAFLRTQGHWLVLGILAAVMVFRSWSQTESGGRTWSRIKVSMPLLGDLVVQSSMQKFSSNLAALLSAGVPLLDTIDALKGIFQDNVVYRMAMRRTAQLVGRGGRLADALEDTGLFTAFLINMTRIGEESGTLPQVHAEVSAFYSRKVETVVSRIASNMETVLIVFMGISVAVILIALYLPLFEMAT